MESMTSIDTHILDKDFKECNSEHVVKGERDLQPLFVSHFIFVDHSTGMHEETLNCQYP